MPLNFYKGGAQRDCVLGQIVRTGPQTFPQGGPGTATLFTVHTGAVLVTSFFGLVTTVPAGDPGFTIGTAPTVGTAETNGIATTVAVTEEAGTWFSVVDTPTTNKPGAITIGAHAGNVTFGILAPFPVSAGAITYTAANAEGGAISWYLTYIPLDEGAYVGALLT
jgi:hypothetical protein